MRKHSLVWAVLLTAVLLLAVSCGSGDRADQWREFTYSVADESGLLSFKVKIKITECYYSLGEAGDVDLTVVYSAGNLGENPIRSTISCERADHAIATATSGSDLSR